MIKLKFLHAKKTKAPQALDYELLIKSELFDADWYLKCNVDVAENNVDPMEHYLTHGGAERRDPSQLFDTSYYLSQLNKLPKHQQDCPNPLLHYLKVGKAAGLQISMQSSLQESELFDADWYLKCNADIAESNVDPVEHYLTHGGAERRDPSQLFDTDYYLSQLHQLPLHQQDCHNPLLHYLTVGKAAGLQISMPASINYDFAKNSAINSVTPIVSLNKVAIIIPVYNAVDELKACLQSLIKHTFMDCRFIIIDDASSDSGVQDLLNDYRSLARFDCYQNDSNLGFTQTVNKGISLAENDDVVLLNSDTQVTPGWLGRLRYAAYQASDIGTVTPFSNNAGAFSAPDAGFNQLPEGVDLDSYARLIAQQSKHLYPEVPTGNGFCLYIRRACLDAVGLLDVEAFPRGYGEENDFCMRATQKGWRHIIDDATYIYHVRSASFGAEKDTLIEAGRKVIDTRYPDYKNLVQRAFSSSILAEARNNVRTIGNQAKQYDKAVKPRVLYVVSSLTGGTPQTNEDLMRALGSDIDCMVLHCDSKVISLKRYADGVYHNLARYSLAEPIKAMKHTSNEYDTVVKAWLNHWVIESVHIRHIGWHSLGLIAVIKQLGLPCFFSFHDFYTVCPTIKLLDDQEKFCGGVCTKGAGHCEAELWPQRDFVELKHGQVKPWQAMFAIALNQCDGFITTTQQAKDLILRTYPLLKDKPFKVIAHGRDFERFYDVAVTPKKNQPLKIVFPGHLNRAKGADVITELATIAPEGSLEIHILGNIDFSVDFPDNVILHGAYKRDDFQQKLMEIKPNIGGVLSLWPETWCHTLTELWASGLPVIGFNIGAVGERIKQSDAGWLVDVFTADAVLTALQLIRQHADWQKKKLFVAAWQENKGKLSDCDLMARQYAAFYDQVQFTPH